MSQHEVRRTQFLDEEIMERMRALFGQTNNIYRWLRLDDTHINLYTLMRAMRRDPCREEDLVLIEARWAQFAREHGFDDASFELPELVKSRDIERKAGGIIRQAKDGRYVEESFEPTSDADYF